MHVKQWIGVERKASQSCVFYMMLVYQDYWQVYFAT